MFPRPTPAALTSQLDMFVDFYTQTGLRACEMLRQVSQLNLQLARDLVAESSANAQRLMASRDLKQLSAAMYAQWTPSGNAFYNYQQKIGEIIARK